MSKNERYIIMQPPYTLDKWKDGAAQVRNEKEFQELVNYIPYDGSIITREGILTLTHTPQSTYEFPENPGEFPIPTEAQTARCCLVLKYNGNNVIDYNSCILHLGTIGTAMGSVSQSGCASVSSSIWKEGNASLRMIIDTVVNTWAGNPASFYSIRGGSTGASSAFYPNYFPGYWNGTTGTCDETLITAWVYPTTLAGTEKTFIEIGNGGTGKGAVKFRMWGDQLQFYTWNSAQGSLADEDITSAFPAANQWYFVAGFGSWHRGVHGIYIYDDVLKTERFTAVTSVANNNHFYYHCALWTFGGQFPAYNGVDGYRNGAASFYGYIDYVTMWDLIFTQATSNITLIRAIRDLHKA